MKCPHCNEQLRDFKDFYLWSHPFTYKCKTCQSRLKPSRQIRFMILMEVIMTILLIILIDSVVRFMSIPGITSYIISMAVLFYPLEKYGYNQGYYTLKE